MSQTFPGKETLVGARRRIARYVHHTPVLTSRLINEMAGCNLFFKCENFQRMGAFKMRGATNAILSLTPSQRADGVVTHSSGNFAQAVALAAQILGIRAYIVMPENTPPVKRAAVESYGGHIVTSGNTPRDREEKAAELVRETGAHFLHPSDQIEVILGNSTAAQELLEDLNDLDIIVVPVGGGGLLAGTALAARHFSAGTQVIGAEPVGADDAYRSLRDGVIYPSENPNTICDGLRTNLGAVNFPIIKSCVEDIILVHDRDTINAMQLIFERMKIVVEPSAAIAPAAVLTHKERFNEKRVGVILSGGNVGMKDLRI